MKLGSLFDGAGTFPFAAQICGIDTLWSSEIEPFPLKVTAKRFPHVKQLGDVTKINGAEIDPVDIITFGSPCQDLSVAGQRKGLDGERSGLFMESVRIIKEMRARTDGIYPRYIIFENVTGIFSSNKGEDFRTVLEELCKIKDCSTVIPRPAKGKWSDAGEIMADEYSIAWRVLDAQFWGVPQRRRRLFLVADFRGQCAGKILFEREGLSRDFTKSRETWKGITKSLAYRADARCWDARGNGDGNISPTITGDHCSRVNDYMPVLCVRERCGCDGGGKGCLVQRYKAGSITTKEDQFLCYAIQGNCFILRRITPTECARLQGMPDWWCDDVPHSDSAEYKMWGNGIALPCALYVMEGIANLKGGGTDG